MFALLGNIPKMKDSTVPMIQSLKAKGYGVYYLSNYFEYLMHTAPWALDFIRYTDGGIFSCHVKITKPDKRIYELLCRSGESTLKLLMNFYQQGILFGFLLALVGLWRRREICQCLLPLIILGGVLYHLLCEAKSQYSFAFFLLMIPIASYGLHFLFEALQGRKNA